jgi:PhnB protein
MSWKPDGYSTVSPYLIVRDARRTLQFMETVFEATRLRVFERPDGAGIMHAEARIDDTVVMMGEMPDAGEANVHVYVHDPDATFKKAIAAGATVVQELKRSGDGDYRGGVADGNGAIWWISKQE